MIRRFVRWLRRSATGSDDSTGEDGVTLILSALLLVVLMGMAGFAVDLGWLYLKTTEAQKAAESSALAGVVHMPNPSSVPWGAGAEAYDTAVDVAVRNGYNPGGGTTVSPSEVLGKPNQLNVAISTSVPTFFMKVFGINSVGFSRSATAEQLPPLKIGSDESYLGTDPTTPGRNRFFFVSVNGEEEYKQNGDPYSTRCLGTAPCAGTPNTQFRDPAYYYAIEVPDGSAGGALSVEIYDPAHWSGNRNDFVNNGNPLATGDRINRNVSITFTLYAPDQTPNDPSDNPPIPGCSRTFNRQPGASSPGIQEWVSLCSVGATSGIYVMAVSVGGNGRSITDFSFRTRLNGNLTNPVAVYGLGSMSIDMIEGGVAPNFNLVKLEEIYSGTELVISLFDPGDVSGGFANLTFRGEAAALECQYRVLNEAGVEIQTWGPDDSPGAAPCFINTSGQRFNNQWVEFRYDIPDAYACSGDCWITADYDFASSASVTERTTWAARINGQPIHLLP